MSNVLFVVTGARSWTLADGSSVPTGYWAEELLTPYRLITGAGHSVTFATPGGVTPVADEVSLAPDANGGADVRPDLDAIDGLGLEITTGSDLSSVTAVLRGATGGPSVLLRGDMDALAIVEER